jgi:uncharacterized membrane protein YdfJ with MMPL/SSD domain
MFRSKSKRTKQPASTRTPAHNFAGRVGQWSAHHWKTAVLAWLIFVVGAVFVGNTVGTKQIKQNEATVGESHKADRILEDAKFTVNKHGESVEEQWETVLIQSKTLKAGDPAFQAAIADVEKTLRTFPQVTKMHSPRAAVWAPDLIAKDKHAARIDFVPKGTYKEAVLYIDKIDAAVKKTGARHGDVSTASIGLTTDKAVDKEIQGGLAKAGMISIPLTILILMIVLGAFVGALIPLMVGLTSVAATFGLVGLSSHGIAASENIMEVVLLIGLAVGVDYSLFYMRREREERAAGRSERAALEAAAATSGHAVLVSGMTVLIAMAGMFLSGDKTFMSFSVGAMLVVGVAMIGSLTVLPAVLGKLGDRVEKGRIPFVGRLRRGAEKRSMWGAITDRVLRRPLASALAAAAVLVVLAVPTLQLTTTQTGMEGITSPAMEPFKQFVKAFPGSPEPTPVAIKADDVTAAPVQKAIAELKARALASGQMHGPIEVDINRDHTVAKVDIPLNGDGTEDASVAALRSLRHDLLPQTVGQVAGVEYAVTGQTANSEDFNSAQTKSMPVVFGFVLLFAFVLLLVTFRSIVIALKAILLNLLSVAAAYGVLVAVFQWGWGENLLNFESNGGIANWLPMFMFVILFGLSMDYHVFILSRIREAHDRGMKTDAAVAHGITSTAGTVTSAAFVMVGVFLVFVTLPLVDLKEMGVGLAIAVLIDATLVRAVLLPATMKLLGERNWYLPSWLNWLPSAGTNEPKFAPVQTPVPVPAGD